MAAKKLIKIKEEEKPKVEETKENDRKIEDDRGTNDSKSGSGDTDNTGGDDRPNGSEGTGETGSENRTSGKSAGTDEKPVGDDREEAKRNLISNIRNKRNKGNTSFTGELNQHDKGTAANGNGGDNGNDKPNELDNRSQSGIFGHSIRSGGTIGNVSGNDDDNNESVSTDSRGLSKPEKPTGLNIKVPPFKPVPSIDRTQKTEDTLTKKEGDQIKPRIVESLRLAFTYSDKGINATTKSKPAEGVLIWGSIDDSELEIIATTIIESGQRNKVIATAVRQVSYNFQRLQLGVILLPRFIATFNVYLQNGFALPFGNKNED